MKIKVTITGTIDVPDSWADGNCGELRTAEYRYNDQLTAEDALGELAEKLQGWQDGRLGIKAHDLVNLARLFDTTTDHILGRT